jgi:FkbM family methyltransferase
MAEVYPNLRAVQRGGDVGPFSLSDRGVSRVAKSCAGVVVDDVSFGAASAAIGHAPADCDGHQRPFGSFAPTWPQAVLLALACNTPLGRGRARWLMGSLIGKLRPGPLDVERLGLKMRLHYAGHETSDKRALLHVGSYDRAEIAALTREISDRGRFVDIGAHTGFYSLAVKSSRPDVSIIAFEPQPVYCGRFRFNIAASGLHDVSLLAAAVGPKAGLRPFFLEQESLLGRGKAIKVKVVPLYETLRQRGFERVDALKIDIEGYEDRVLFPFFHDAPSSMWPRIIVIEHCLQSAWKRNCLQLAASLGYRPIHVGKANTVLLRRT